MTITKNSKCALGFLLVFLLFSCATKSKAYREIDNAVEKNDYEGAVSAVKAGQEKKRPVYPERNAILLFLDKGLLEYYSGNYENSSKDLQEAERLIQEAYTKSITAGFLSYIANDNTKEYPGEDFEDIYINVFNALNYYKRGDIEGALVEIRKLSISNGKLDMLARKYQYKDPSSGLSLEELAKRESSSAKLPQGKPVNFSNSALARYLSALFYLADGKTDSARIEFEQLQRAYLTNRNVYSNPVPAAVEQAQNVPAGMARLNFISFTGLSPIKEEEVITYYYPFLFYSVLTTANFKLPKLVKRPNKIERIEVVIDDQKVELELLEDMGAVIQETFSLRYTSIVMKTYIRTMIKYAAADIAAIAILSSNKDAELLAAATALSAKMAFDATENADIRMARYLPNKAHIGGINLKPGTYDVTVNFYSKGGGIVRQEQRTVTVRENALNLLDIVSLN